MRPMTTIITVRRDTRPDALGWLLADADCTVEFATFAEARAFVPAAQALGVSLAYYGPDEPMFDEDALCEEAEWAAWEAGGRDRYEAWDRV